MIANRNQLWGRVVAEELVRSGVRDVCLSPGSRSTPLALGVHGQPGLRITSHLDERSGAYFGLGIGLATRTPAALVCTSGTAAANYHPAVVEAAQSGVPLLVLTADRPPELRDVGANQSIDQQRLFGRHVRWFADAGLPEPTPLSVRHLRGLVCRAVAKARGPIPGPVHINFPFREPLEPTVVPGDVPDGWADGDPIVAQGRGSDPFLRVDAGILQPDAGLLAEVGSLIQDARSGTIVVGPRRADPGFVQAINGLSRATGFPILADPLSNVRFASESSENLISAYDTWLADPRRRAAFAPEVILRFGRAPTSKNLLTWLKERGTSKQVLFDEGGDVGEETARTAIVVGGDATTAAARLGSSRDGPAMAAAELGWDRAARLVIRKVTNGRPFEGALMQKLLEELPPHTPLFVSSSLPVRDLDRFGVARADPLTVFANRGASGIDGVVSSALGVAHALQRKVVLVIGDIAFLHDVGALATRRRLSLPLDVLLVNNDGGGIFDFLPVAKHEPPFTELFATPHGLDLAQVANALGMTAHSLPIEDALTGRLGLGDPAASPRLVEVRTRRSENVRHRRELEALVSQALSESLPEGPRVP